MFSQSSEFRDSLMQILNLNPNLSRYWSKLSQTYLEENPEKSYLCLLLSKHYSVGQDQKLLEDKLSELSNLNPGLNLTKINLKNPGYEDGEKLTKEFNDLGNLLKLKMFFFRNANLG